MNFCSSSRSSSRLRFITIVTVTGLFLTSCSRPVFNLENPPFDCPTANRSLQSEDPQAQPSEDPQAQPLNIAVHIDGSGSMLGYVPTQKPSETQYSRMLEFLNNMFVDNKDPLLGSQAALPQPILKYFRTGLNKETKVSQEAFQFKSPGSLDPRFKPFYEAEVTSQLQSAISPPSSGQDQLSVLISDLDQDNSAIQKIIQAIQSNYLNGKTPHYSVALLGVMNEFNGKVYSTDPQKFSDFFYTQSRPVYLVWIGTNDRLSFYLEKFTNKLKQSGFTYNLSIFSPQGLTQGFALNLSSSIDPNISPEPNAEQASDQVSNLPDGIDRSAVLDSSEFVLVQENALAELLSLSSRAIESAQTIPYTVTVNQPDNFSSLQPLVVDVAQLKTESEQIKNWQFNPDTKTIDLADPPSSALQLQNITQNNNSLSFEAVIDPNPLDSNIIYPYRFDVLASELEVHDWWKEWDWGKRADNEDGSKTYQLLRFTESLQTSALDALPQAKTIGSLCFAVQKN